MRRLAEQLDALCDAQPFVTTWALRDLRSGAQAGRESRRVVPAGSTRKVTILMTALHALHLGRFGDWDAPDIVVLPSDQRRSVSGVLRFLVFDAPAMRFSLRNLLTLMIVLSDNVATAAVVRALGGIGVVQAYTRRIGLRCTTHRYDIPPPADTLYVPTTTTAADQLSLLLMLLACASSDACAEARLGCTRAQCQWALQTLSRQQFNRMLPALLPPTVPCPCPGALAGGSCPVTVAHKTGRFKQQARGDVGIVLVADRPLFALAVYVDHIPATVRSLPGAAVVRQHIATLALVCWRRELGAPP